MFLTALAAVSQVLSFGYRVALSRTVGAEVMGLYQLLMPVYSVLLSLAAVGVTACASNLSAQYLALDNGRALEQLRRLCLGLLLTVTAVTAACVVWFYDPISVYLLGDARTQLGLVLLLPCALLTGVENIHKHLFYGAGLVRTPALTELAEQFIRAAAVLGLLWAFLPQNPERSVGLIVCGMVICEIFSAVTLTLLYRRRFAGVRTRGPGEARGALLRRMGGIALPVGATALLGNLMGAANAALIPRKLVEGGLERGAAVAQFGVVCGMTMPMLTLPTVFLGAVNLILVPRLARCAALGQRERARALAERALELVSALILPSMALMVVLGPDLAELMFGEPEAGRFLLPLAAAVALSGVQAVFRGVLNGMGRQGPAALVSLLCDGVQLAFVFTVPLPGVGIRGYVAGTLCACALEAGLCGWLARRALGVRLPLFRAVTAPGLAALLAGLTANLLLRCLKDSGLAALPACLAVLLYGAVLYLAALQAQGVTVKGLIRG